MCRGKLGIKDWHWSRCVYQGKTSRIRSTALCGKGYLQQARSQKQMQLANRSWNCAALQISSTFTFLICGREMTYVQGFLPGLGTLNRI